MSSLVIDRSAVKVDYPDSDNRCGDDPPDPIIGLLQLPLPGGMCPLGPPLHLCSKSRPHQQQVVRVSCRSWRCKVCSGRLRQRAGIHHGRLIDASDRELFVSRRDAATWGKDRKRLFRAGASWVRIDAGSEATVIGTAALPDGKPVCTSDALVSLGEALRSIRYCDPGPGKRFKPITASDDWTPPVRRSTHDLIGQVSLYDPDPVLAVLADCGVIGKTSPGDGVEARWRVRWSFPADFTPSEVAELSRKVNAVLAGKMSPVKRQLVFPVSDN